MVYGRTLMMVEEYDPGADALETEIRRWPTKLIASCLLVIMLCAIATTPLALLYNTFRERSQARAAVVEEKSQFAGLNRIAYITTAQQLVTIDPDGSNRRAITSGGQPFQFPAWSPDGSRIGVIGGQSIFTFLDQDNAQESGAFRLLYENDEMRPFYLYWTPDSSGITFLTTHDDGLALYLAHIDGEPPAEPTAVGQPFYWDWVPSGAEMLIHTGVRGEDARLAFLSPEKQTIGENIASPGLFQAPGISHDGQYWAYAEEDSEQGNRLVISDEQGRVFSHVQGSGSLALGWSPTANRLAFISSEGDFPTYFGPLRLVDPETGSNRVLVSDIVVAFFWSPDGRAIAYFTFADLGEDAVQVNDKSSAGKFQAKSSVQQQLRLELWVVDIPGDRPRRVAIFEPSDLFLNQFLPFFDQYALSHRIWSPAGDALVVPFVKDDVPYLHLVPASGDEPRTIAPGLIGFWSQQ